jgi:hypothetical protein
VRPDFGLQWASFNGKAPRLSHTPGSRKGLGSYFLLPLFGINAAQYTIKIPDNSMVIVIIEKIVLHGSFIFILG